MFVEARWKTDSTLACGATRFSFWLECPLSDRVLRNFRLILLEVHRLLCWAETNQAVCHARTACSLNHEKTIAAEAASFYFHMYVMRLE